jgi:Leucine-rich repeat (LRR) protein
LTTALFKAIQEVTAKEVGCEGFSVSSWDNYIGKIKVCHMNNYTSIDSAEVPFTKRDDSIFGLDFYNNKKIFFLPIQVGENFLNLIAYLAHDCSVKEISQRNFKGLNKLKKLSLGGNQIENIPNDTFNDLVVLEFLSLRKKKKNLNIICANL